MTENLSDAAVIDARERFCDSPPAFDDEIESVCELADLSRGAFSLALVLFDLPRQRRKLTERRHAEMEKLRLTESLFAPNN
jgi:hypothetical protein